jgi:putative oxidoreductase
VGDREHFSRGIIPPMVLCNTSSISYCDVLFLRAPTRYELDRVKLGGQTMDQIDKMLAKFQPPALSLFRFITGLLLFQFGVAKLLKFPTIPAGNPYAFLNKVELMSLPGAAGALELILGALLLLGLFTRPVAFLLAGEMAFAYFIAHAGRSFYPLINGGTLAIMFCFACLYLSTSGGGPYSLDAMLRKK